MVDSRDCNKCRLNKPLSEFSRSSRGLRGVKATCKACDAARHRAQFVPAVVDEAAKEARYTARRSNEKRCSQCGETKPIEQFSKTRDGKYGPVLRSNCKACASARAYRWFLDNRDRAKEVQRNRNMVLNYGITADEYRQRAEQQRHVCAICRKPETVERDGKVMLLSVDHCHSTGRVRGLLCNNCNRAIGLLKDNVELLRKAVDYLEGR